MTGVPSGVVPIVLRVGATVLLVLGQSRMTPGPGLHGTGLAITVLIAALAATLLSGVFIPLLGPSRELPEARGTRLPEVWRRLTSPVAQPPRFLGAPIALINLSLGVVLAIALDAVAPNGPAVAVLLFCVAAAAVRHPLSQAAFVGVLAIVGLAVTSTLSGGPERDLPLMLGICLIFLVSYSARQRRAARAAEAREAVLDERARIAREIHDILAHSLSAQLVHLEGAKLLLRAERTDEALDRVTRARDLAKSGLEEARRAVSALREDPPELPSALRSLAEEFESLTHQTCSLSVTGRERRLSPETELTLIRTAQEALTNVRRHSPGTPARIDLTFDPATCDLLVTNPTTEKKGTPGGGYGLMGMRERAELLGGTLAAGEHDGHFRVHLAVPA